MTDFPLFLDPFERRHIGPHGAFTHRADPHHVDLSRAAVAHRMDVPVGHISIAWPWKAQDNVVPMKRKAAA